MIASFFTNPWILAALCAVLIPPIIEWLFRRRKRKVDLPSIIYLLRSKDQEQVKRQDRILLILRMILVFLLVMALSRPLIQHGLVGSASTREVLILLDNTASMNQQVGVTTSFGMGQKKAAGMVRGLPEETPVTVLQISDRVEVLLEAETDHYTVADKISGLRPGSGAAPIEEGLSWSFDFLQKKSKGNPEVYIFTDFQKYTWARGGTQLENTSKALTKITQSYETYLVDVGGTPTYNFMVTDLIPKEKVISAGMPTEFIARIETKGEPPKDAKATATFLVNGKKKDVREITPGKDPSTVVFEYPFIGAGEYLVEVIVDGDEHPTDNRRRYLCMVPDSVRVLILDEGAESPEPKSHFLSRAIAPPHPPGTDRISPFSVTTAHPRQIAFENLDNYRLVVLTDVDYSTINEAMVNKLERYASDGGAVWIFVGPKVTQSLYNYNKYLYKEGKGLLPAKLSKLISVVMGEGSKGPVFFRPGTSTHAAMQELSHQGGYEDCLYLRYIQFEASKGGKVPGEVVASLSDGTPTMLEHPLGRGKVLISNSTAGTEWNYLPATETFPVMVQEMLRYLVGNPDAGVNLSVGDTFKSPVFISSKHLLLFYPDGTKAPRITPVKRSDREEAWSMSFDRTHQQGLYRIEAPAEVLPRRRFVVNQSPEEGDLARLQKGDFSDVFGSTGWKWIPPEMSVVSFASNLHTVTELGPYFLWLMLIVITVESFLAARFGKRRGGSQQ